MSNKNTKKNLGTEFDIFDRTGEVGMYNFGYMNSSFCFHSVTNYDVRTLTAEPSPSSHMSKYAFSGTLSLPLRSYVLYG